MANSIFEFVLLAYLNLYSDHSSNTGQRAAQYVVELRHGRYSRAWSIAEIEATQSYYQLFN